MLKEIAIHNFAIIDELELTFSDGFNAFTGETGAGKSIILDAVSMVLGGKSDPTFVRDGSGRAVIEAVFSCGDYKEVIREILLREDLLDETDFEELIMTREIRAEGRSIARINGHNVSLSVMHEIGEYFVDIHGQSEHLSLLNPRNHIHILDRFAMNQDLLKVYHEKLKKLQTVQRQLKSLRVGEEESLRQKDMLTFQINEIESAKISENEEVDLIKERDRLGNIENLSKYIRQSIQYLEGNNTEIPGIIDLLGLLTKSFENLVKNDSDIQTVSDTVFSISEQANEIYDFLQHYQDRLEFNPHRLEQIEERLMIINGLKRKYGGSIPNVLSFALKAQEKLSHLENSEEEIENLVEQEKQLLNELSLIACQLSEKRIASARKVSQDVEKELGDLHMANAKFQVSMTTREDENGLLNSSGQRFAFNENGFDEVEFLIAPNPGEGLKPL